MFVWSTLVRFDQNSCTRDILLENVASHVVPLFDYFLLQQVFPRLADRGGSSGVPIGVQFKVSRILAVVQVPVDQIFDVADNRMFP